MSKEKLECSYLPFRIVFIFVRGDPLTLFDPVPKSMFDFGLTNGSENSLYFSKKLRIVIGMEISELII
jgi:hypothetical protein